MKLQATYIWDTSGKFPGTIPTVWIMNYLQAQHFDSATESSAWHSGTGVWRSVVSNHSRVVR